MKDFLKKPRVWGPIVILLCCSLLSGIDHPALTLLPPIVAILSVILLRSAFKGLLIGAYTGAILLSGGNLFSAAMDLAIMHLLQALYSPWNLTILFFTLLLGGFAAILEKGRGFDSILEKWLKGSGNSGKKVQWSAYFMGLLCFFDGLASSLLTGKSLRPVSDKVGVSRAKLAYIVDSTGSAVACVAIMSTWIAYQLSIIHAGYEAVEITDVEPFLIFLQSIPRNFYCWFTLILLAVVIGRSWNFGPMKSFEAKADEKKLSEPETTTIGTPGKARQFFTPLLFLIVLMLGGLYYSGVNGDLLPITFEKIKYAFGNAESNFVLLTSTILACFVAALYNRKTINQSSSTGYVFLEGIRSFFNPCMILLAAWCLSSTLKELETSKFLVAQLSDTLPIPLFPSMVFLLGVLISFTTGTSWGTMGVLMPLALPICFAMSPGDQEMVATVVAAVFSGAVFGDHCSPLSDTTIVSSLACDIEPYDHVKTQLPYAIVSALLAVLLGFLPLGYGVPPMICLIGGGLVIYFLPSIHKWIPRKASMP